MKGTWPEPTWNGTRLEMDRNGSIGFPDRRLLERLAR